MDTFIPNSVGFSVDCVKDDGRCSVKRGNIIFLDEGTEHDAVVYLEMKCGHVVIIPDESDKDQALLYHTSCQRMTDVVGQIFQEHLQAPTSLPQRLSEMTLGELHRRCIVIPYDHCKARVKDFSF